MRGRCIYDYKRMSDNKSQKNRNQRKHGLFHPSQVYYRKDRNTSDCKLKFICLPFYRKKAENSIRTARNRNSNRKYIIYDERATRKHTQSGGQQFTGNEISTTT